VNYILIILRTLRFIVGHPLNRNRKFWAIRRYFYWQIGSRLLPGAVVMPWVDGSSLLVSRGVAASTGNIYVGLHEYNEMAFVLHCLRKDDLFVDIGANIGTYTILASAVVGARTMAYEPVPSTHRYLKNNIALNKIDTLVQAHQEALGSAAADMRITTDHDSGNRLLVEGESDVSASVMTRVNTLDLSLGDKVPTIIKIDVEGSEGAVLDGASKVLGKIGLLAIIVELIGSGSRYGYADDEVHKKILASGFSGYAYDVSNRRLIPAQPGNTGTDNLIYVRDTGLVAERLRSSRRYLVHGTAV